MNQKQQELNRILDTVVSCCATSYDDGTVSLTRSDVIGRSRSEVVVMTRAILVEMIIAAGYSTMTAAALLQRDVHSIRYLMSLGSRLRQTSRAYRIAADEAASLCKSYTQSA